VNDNPEGSAMSVMPLWEAPASYVQAAGYEVGTGRLVPSLAAVVALVSVVLGWVAVTRFARRAAYSALGFGLVGAAVGAVHAANAAGGLGTGNGLAGAVVAVVLGLVGAVLAGWALARSRRRPVEDAQGA
jgi:hypothetical protein